MANIKSAKKRIKTIDRRHGENKFVKSTLATYVKNFNKLLQEGNIAEAESKLTSTISYIDSACSKGILTRNTASRKISRLSRALYKAKVNGSKPASEVVEKVEEKVNFYNISSKDHINVYAENVLTSNRLNNRFEIKNNKFTDRQIMTDEEIKAYKEHLERLKK